VPVLAAPDGQVEAEGRMASADGQPLTRCERAERAGDEQVAALVEAQVGEVDDVGDRQGGRWVLTDGSPPR
jgi:hypothetical protein